MIKENSDYTKDKPSLLFLHGYGSFGKSFAPQIAFFKKDYNVYYPDMKGFGENKDMPYPYSLGDYAEEIKEYMSRNGIEKPCVVAHSFGARVAIKLAAENGEIFDKIVLTGAAGLKPKFSLKKAIKKTIFGIATKFVPKRKLSAFYSKDYRALSPVMKESFVKIVNENLDGLISHVKNPTLIIFGDKDKETPLYMAKRLNSGIENSKLVIFNGAGHFAFLDKPMKFNAEVKEFLLY